MYVMCSKQTTRVPMRITSSWMQGKRGFSLQKKQTCKKFYAICGDILEEIENEIAVIDCNAHFPENPRFWLKPSLLMRTQYRIVESMAAIIVGNRCL